MRPAPSLPAKDYVLLRPSEVKVDETVQRNFDENHANRIAKAYDPVLFGLGHVSLREDGYYYVLDGQHRVHAAIEAGHGDTAILFRVYRGLSHEQEAVLFLQLNANKKAVGALDKFRLSVEAESPVHLDIARILDSFGLRVAANHTDGGVSAVVALEQIYRGRVGTKTAPMPHGTADLPESHLLSRTLHVLVKAWGKNRDAFDGVLLKGCAALLNKHGAAIDAVSLSRSLAKSGTPALAIGHIKSLSEIAKKTRVMAAVEYLEGVYNRGRSAAKRLGQ